MLSDVVPPALCARCDDDDIIKEMLWALSVYVCVYLCWFGFREVRGTYKQQTTAHQRTRLTRAAEVNANNAVLTVAIIDAVCVSAA